MTLKNILVIGSGGREHAFVWKLRQSPKIDKIFALPGNAGTSEIAINLDINVTDFESIKKAVYDNNINFVLVGPELPIVNGIYDYFRNDEQLNKIPIIAPSKLGAQLEGSKSFAKHFMLKYNIPTAKYHVITKQNINEGIDFINSLKPPYVLKADGLAAGKGVIIVNDSKQAEETLLDILNGKFSSAGDKVVIEQYLNGIEMSCFVITDGTNYFLLPEAKDYKRIGEGDKGLNTGGMGAVSPVPFVDDKLKEKIINLIVHRTIFGLKAEKIVYKGFVFVGLMICNGEPYVIEYNVRMGDPETQVVIPRIESDFFELLESAWNETLNDFKLNISDKKYVSVIASSKGYPEKYENNKLINGLNNSSSEGIIFHAGTIKKDNKIYTSGGRVLSVTNYGTSIKEAVDKSLCQLKNINFDGVYFRKDIGYEFY